MATKYLQRMQMVSEKMFRLPNQSLLLLEEAVHSTAEDR